MSGYKQNDNSQMFLQSVFSVHYLDISCIYMLLASAVTTFLPLIFYIFSEHLFWNISYTAGKISIRPKGMFFPEMFSDVNNSDIFPKYDML